MRQVALKAAVEWWSGCPDDRLNDWTASGAIVGTAEDFYQWMVLPFQSATQPQQAAQQPAPMPRGPRVDPPAGTVIDTQNCPDHPGMSQDSKFENQLRWCTWKQGDAKCEWGVREFVNDNPDGTKSVVTKWKYRGRWLYENDYRAEIGGGMVEAGDIPFE